MDWKDKKVLVFGSGKSGMGAAGLLSSLEACPIIFDSNEKVDRQAIEKKLCGRGRSAWAMFRRRLWMPWIWWS